MFNLQGSIAALVTPMETEGDINWECLKDLIEWHIASNTSGLVIVGTTGESATLDVAEHVQIIERSVDISSGRIKIIAGTGANSTKEAIYLTNAARSAGADASLLVTPYYNKPTQEGLYRHYMMIADEVSLPQILYNVPSRTGCDLLSETVIRVADHDNIVGLKDATGDLSRLEELLKLLEAKEIGDFYLYSGDDPTATSFILKGGKGTISVTANIVPEIISEICKRCEDYLVIRPKYAEIVPLWGICSRAVRTLASFYREVDFRDKIKQELSSRGITCEVSLPDPDVDTKDHTDVIVVIDKIEYRIWLFQNSTNGVIHTSDRVAGNRGKLLGGIHVLCGHDRDQDGHEETVEGWNLFSDDRVEGVVSKIISVHSGKTSPEQYTDVKNILEGPKNLLSNMTVFEV